MRVISIHHDISDLNKLNTVFCKKGFSVMNSGSLDRDQDADNACLLRRKPDYHQNFNSSELAWDYIISAVHEFSQYEKLVMTEV